MRYDEVFIFVGEGRLTHAFWHSKTWKVLICYTRSHEAPGGKVCGYMNLFQGDHLVEVWEMCMEIAML